MLPAECKKPTRHNSPSAGHSLVLARKGERLLASILLLGFVYLSTNCRSSKSKSGKTVGQPTPELPAGTQPEQQPDGGLPQPQTADDPAATNTASPKSAPKPTALAPPEDNTNCNGNTQDPTSHTAACPEERHTPHPPQQPASQPKATPAEPVDLPDSFAKPSCQAKHEGQCLKIEAPLDEASGLAQSSRQDNLFFSHNDDGPANVYAIDSSGEILTTINLDGVVNHDFEDIASYRDAGESWLFVGDIGNGAGIPGQVVIFGFLEPEIKSPPAKAIFIPRASIATIDLSYKDTAPSELLDFESLMIDPITGTIYIFEKGRQRLFFIKRPDYIGHHTGELRTANFAGAWTTHPSGAAFSPTGREFVIRDEKQAWLFNVLATDRNSPDPVIAALSRKPVPINLPVEFNGEAITFDRSGRDLFTVSETDILSHKGNPMSIIKRLIP